MAEAAAEVAQMVDHVEAAEGAAVCPQVPLVAAAVGG